MDMQSFLDELIKTGREYAEKGQKMAEEQLNISNDSDTREATLDGMKKGAIAAGVLAILLGTESGRKLTGSALKIGSLAAVGGIAWKTLQNWQEAQAKRSAEVKEAAEAAMAKRQPKALSVDKLEGKEAEERSQVLVKAMIAAAKSDGKMDDTEIEAINEQIKKLGLGDNIESVLKQGVVTPLSARSVAKMADNEETAAEIYIVSMLVTNLESEQEKKYMDSLAEALELPNEVVKELESYRDPVA